MTFLAPADGDTAPDMATAWALRLGGVNLPAAAPSACLADLPAPGARALVLFVYPRDATAGCTQEADEFQARLPAFARARVSVAGVSKDGVSAHRRFAADRGYTFALLADPERRLLHALGTVVDGTLYGRPVRRTRRSTFLFSADGRWLRTWAGVEPAGHAAAVLDAVTLADP